MNTSSVTFTINSFLPTISFISPSNGLVSNDNDLNITYSVSGTNIDSCWYSDNGGSNTTLTGCANITAVTWSEGSHTVIVYANNTGAFVGSNTINFEMNNKC